MLDGKTSNARETFRREVLPGFRRCRSRRVRALAARMAKCRGGSVRLHWWQVAMMEPREVLLGGLEQRHKALGENLTLSRRCIVEIDGPLEHAVQRA